MEDITIKQESGKKEVPKSVVKQTATPTVVSSSKHASMATPVVFKNSNNNKNTITLIALDSEGNEKGNEFIVSEKEYYRSFSDEKKFKFKKKAK